ncbi:MAG: hypothetical protein K0Q95_2913 [Bacteroidota bacterium]|jgi:asparagine synthase (glutamine-hydrolysing)|nr:hypothetical protein [Bacteroidota bacterium]
MCGIAGILGAAFTPDENIIRKMTGAIAHRGPDGEGIWLNHEHKIGLGHRRLSIIDLSDNGNQPMHYMHYVITFNGEIYNYLELQELLKRKGYTFQSNSDTEVIMAAYDHWGIDCLKEFDGMFAFALYNKNTKDLFCARDRFGEKPFYYNIDNSQLTFASEMKALWSIGIRKQINDHNVYLYLNFNLHEDPNNPTQTYFTAINKLQAGHFFIYNAGGTVVQKKYWDIDLTQQNNEITFEAACDSFRELFFTSVKRRLRSDVSVGTSLSGGLDSSSVVVTIDRLLNDPNQKQNTFSARFNDPRYDEGSYMSQVIEGKNIIHHCTFPDHNVMINELPKIMYHQEEPFATASIFAQWEVFKLAKKENVVVLLDGQGADEYLAGYTHFFIPFLREKYLMGGTKLLNASIAEMKEHNIFQEEIELDLFFKAESHLPSLFNQIRKVKHTILGVSSDNAIHQNLLQNFKNKKAPFENFTSLNQALYHSTFNSGLEKLLRFADRNSMAFSREVRLPFLNHELVEFVFSLPSDFKIKEGWTKAIVRYSLKDILPVDITWRKNKLGFQPPQEQWMESKTWKDWASDYHNISVRKSWIKDTAPVSWKSVNLGIFEEMLQNKSI